MLCLFNPEFTARKIAHECKMAILNFDAQHAILLYLFNPEFIARKIAHECKMAILNFDAQREVKIIEVNNLGAFYKFVNNKLNNHCGIAPLSDASNNFIFSDIEKANLLNDYFQSVFTQDDGSLPRFPKRTHSPDSICDVNITPTIVRKIIHKLKTNSTAGPDTLPPVFFLRTEPLITFPLFCSLTDLHTLPIEWKLSIISPIFKKGSLSNPANYRPIAVPPAKYLNP